MMRPREVLRSESQNHFSSGELRHLKADKDDMNISIGFMQKRPEGPDDRWQWNRARYWLALSCLLSKCRIWHRKDAMMHSSSQQGATLFHSQIFWKTRNFQKSFLSRIYIFPSGMWQSASDSKHILAVKEGIKRFALFVGFVCICAHFTIATIFCSAEFDHIGA